MGLPDWNTALTFLAGVIATLATVFSSRPAGEKHQKEGDATLSEATMKWAQGLREEMERMRTDYRAEIKELENKSGEKIDRLTGRITILERENSTFRRHNALLIGQLTGAGLTPLEVPSHLQPSPLD